MANSTLGFILAAAIAALVPVAAVQAAPTYSYVDLGSPPGGATPTSLNDLGHVASYGFTGTTTHAFVWRNGTVTDLGDLPGGSDESQAYGINDDGQVVGWGFGEGDRHATLWQNGTITDLGVLPGGSFSEARGINDAGRITGYSHSDTGVHAVVWQAGTDIITALPDAGFSQGFAINDAGNVAGVANVGARLHAFLWRDGTMIDLGELPGGDEFSTALALNDTGQVVGYSAGGDVSSPEHAFLWQAGIGMIDLGVLPGSDFSRAFGINDDGQVVGASGTTENGRAFFWEDGAMFDLNDLVLDLGDWRLLGAAAINDAGQVVVSASRPGSFGHVLLLTPAQVSVPAPPAVLLFAAGVAGLAALRRRT